MFLSQPFTWLAGLQSNIEYYPRKKYFNISLSFEIGGDVKNILWETFILRLLYDRADLEKILLDVADSTLRKIFSTKKETRSFLHRLTWSDGLEENTFRHRHIRSSRLGYSLPEEGNFFFFDFTGDTRDWDRVVLVFLHQSPIPTLRLGICQKIYTTQFSGEKILHTENA